MDKQSSLDQLRDRLERLTSNQEHETSSNQNHELISSLLFSIQSSKFQQSQYRDNYQEDEEDEEEENEEDSLWKDLLRVASDIESEEEEVVVFQPQPRTSSTHATIRQSSSNSNSDSIPIPNSNSPSNKLLNYLKIAFEDESLQESMLQSIIELLNSNHSSDDEISMLLAELIGFEQLELVTELMSDRKQVGDQLKGGMEKTTFQEPQQSSQPQPFYQEPSSRQDSRLKPASKPYTPGAQVVIQTAEEKDLAKRIRAEQKRAHKVSHSLEADRHYTAEEMEQIRIDSLEANANRPLFSHEGISTDQPSYPHVFSSGAHGNSLSIFGSKFSLPVGTTRMEKQFYEEVTIPPPRQVPFRMNERLIPIDEMDSLSRGAFPGYKSLNRLQSVVYPLGYGSNENLLVCAPTGAGKTDVAMLTVLRAIGQHARNLEPIAGKGSEGFGINKDDFKIVYVAPMKALAAEIVRKFSKRLNYLGVKVRELTGDMQLTRQEIADTQMIVTTPEKWDVVTRKPTGEGELATKVKLLIIDEVHLLHEDRGAVIETIVARTLRLVESSQSLIRIVGLSATLPNYVDVADFLRVNRYQGLFYFDSSFRPVPLEQHFLGVKGKPGSPISRTNLDKAAFEKVSQLVQDGHQVMVFVHARKETVKTAQTLREMFHSEGLDDFLTGNNSTSTLDDLVEGKGKGKRKAPSQNIEAFRKDLQASRNKEMKELADQGFGIHHAGMLRSDRNISERMFESGVTKVLCCTATLAWGVNLPAFAVLIKGTEVYDSSVGKFVDLSILDVLQIFGRAGRPQYEDLGVGYICTNNDKLSHYVDAITSQHPIESKFIKGLIDSLNAEVALGTVTSIQDGVSWLGYTYLFTRMKRNPLSYGMPHNEVADDPHLGAKRLQLITSGAKALAAAKMMNYDEFTGQVSVTDLGRIAARYYIPHRTIEVFNEKLRAQMREADVLSVLSLATDFEQIIPRDSEEKELKKMQENAPCEVADGTSTSAGKVNILLQAHISRVFVEDFALVSDSAYVAQNSGRIIRALTEIALSRKWAPVTSSLMAMSKAVERRIWPFDHPLSQSSLSPDTVFNITRWADEVEVSTLSEMSASEIATLIHQNERIGGFVKSAAKQFPSLGATFALRPITNDILRITVTISRAFEWNEKVHGGMEPFYIWVEDSEGLEILQWAQLHVRPQTTKTDLTFDISVADGIEGVSIRWISDRWLGSEDSIWISFDDLIVPDVPSPHLELLDLPLLPVSILKGTLADQDRFNHFLAFNAIQTQCFHTLMHSSADLLLCAPLASGKTTLAEMAIWRAAEEPGALSVLVINPHYLSARRHAENFKSSNRNASHLSVRFATSRKDILEKRSGSEVIFTTPQTLLRALISSDKSLDRFQLVIAEDLHLLGTNYELALSRLLRMKSSGKLRLVATSASLHDSSSLSSWLGIKPEATYSFHPKDRPSPLQLSFQGFDLPHSLNLLKTMVKPAYDKIKATASKGPAIVFLPSRAQCMTVAGDLVRSSAADIDSDPLMGGTASEEVEPYLSILKDRNLFEPLLHGIGVYHDGMSNRDQNVILQMFERGLIRVLIAPREATLTLQAKAHLVIIMSTQFIKIVPVDPSRSKSKEVSSNMPMVDRKVTDYEVTDLVKLESFALRNGTPSQPNPPGECLVLCQSNQIHYLRRMMTMGLPLESDLLEEENSTLISYVLEELVAGNLKNKLDLVDLLSWSYLYKSLQRNPSYYDCLSSDQQDVSTCLSKAVDRIVEKLEKIGCLKIVADRKKDGLVPLNITNLARSINSETVSDLIKIQSRAIDQPSFAIEMIQAVEKKSKNSQKERIGKEESLVLKATRSMIPSNLLSSWSIPKGGKFESKVKPQFNGSAHPESQPSQVNENRTGKNEESEMESDEEFTSSQKMSILIAAFFAVRSICTPEEAENSRSKSKSKQEVESVDSNHLGLELKSQVEKMEKYQIDLVFSLLEVFRNENGMMV